MLADACCIRPTHLSVTGLSPRQAKKVGPQTTPELASARTQLDQASFPGRGEGLLRNRGTSEDIMVVGFRRDLSSARSSLLWRAATVSRIGIAPAASRQSLASQRDPDGHQGHEKRESEDGNENRGRHGENLANLGRGTRYGSPKSCTGALIPQRMGQFFSKSKREKASLCLVSKPPPNLCSIM